MSGEPDPFAEGKRNSWILMAANAVNGSGAIITVSLGGLTGAYLLGEDKSLATLPVAGFNLGVALGAIPAAILMHWVGRRLGLMAGSGVAMVGALAAAGAISLDSFALFGFALIFIGVATAFVQQYRFAVIETLPPELRPVGISRVLIGGVITAIIGPQIVLYTRDLFDPLPFAGSFLALAGVVLVGMLILSFLRFPPAKQRRAQASADPVPPRPFAEIARQPRFLIALACAATSFALMAFVMTAAPLAMVEHHHSESDAVLGIQWHVIAMFGPSIFTGRLIRRFGKETIIAVGLTLLILSALVGIAGLELLHFWGMLILLGVGWNFAFVGATAMLTDTYRPSERARVEGINDLVVFGSVTVASIFSGTILISGGWSAVNYVVMPIVAIVLFALGVFVVRDRRMPA